MTVSNTTTKVTAQGDGSATVFSFSPLVLYANTDLIAVKVAVDGTETTLSEGTGTANYSMRVSAYPGTGSIVYPASGTGYLATGEKIVMKRKLPLTQTRHFESQGGYFPEDVEQVADRAAMVDLQQQEEIDRSLKIAVADGEVSADLPVASLRANNLLAFDAAGNATVIAPSSVATVAAFSDFKREQFSSDGVTAYVDLSASPGVIENLNIYFDGVQQPQQEYTLLNKRVTFVNGAPAIGVNIEVKYGRALPQADIEQSKADAAASAVDAQASANTATTQAGIATTQANSASASAATATTQAGIATTEASIATAQAAIATAKAADAGASAVAANDSATSAAAQVTLATAQVALATTQANSASASANTATTKATEASASAAAAAGVLANLSNLSALVDEGLITDAVTNTIDDGSVP